VEGRPDAIERIERAKQKPVTDTCDHDHDHDRARAPPVTVTPSRTPNVPRREDRNEQALAVTGDDHPEPSGVRGGSLGGP
jgi:hypothetical protein